MAGHWTDEELGGERWRVNYENGEVRRAYLPDAHGMGIVNLERDRETGALALRVSGAKEVVATARDLADAVRLAHGHIAGHVGLADRLERARRAQEHGTASVYVANLGKYNEGELAGAWIKLPVPDRELERFLREDVGVEPDSQAAIEAEARGERAYEEYAIHDYEFQGLLSGLGYRPSEHGSLSDLNLLAKCAQQAGLDGSRLAAVREFMGQQGLAPSALEYANAVAQADEIPFYPYDLPRGMTMGSCSGLEEAVGYTLAYEELSESLAASASGTALAGYFDFERFGRDMAHDFALSREGYLDLAQDGPDLDRFSREKLAEGYGKAWDEERALAEEQRTADKAGAVAVRGRTAELAPVALGKPPAAARENAELSAQARNGQAPSRQSRQSPTI